MPCETDIQKHKAPMAWRPVPRHPLHDAITKESSPTTWERRTPTELEVSGEAPDSGRTHSHEALLSVSSESAH